MTIKAFATPGLTPDVLAGGLLALEALRTVGDSLTTPEGGLKLAIGEQTLRAPVSVSFQRQDTAAVTVMSFDSHRSLIGQAEDALAHPSGRHKTPPPGQKP